MASEGTDMAKFTAKMLNISMTGMLSLVVAIGKELKLFEILGELSSEGNPVTPEAVAQRGDLKPRYVREWLSSVACADIVEVTEDGEKFWISDEKKTVLCGAHEAMDMLMFTQQCVPVYKTMTQVFRKDGPKGTTYDQYDDFITQLSNMSTGYYEKYLISDILPLTGVQVNGIRILDVGCGNGFVVNHLAKHFPESNLFGVDNNEDAVNKAKKAALEQNLLNSVFVNCDAAALPREWTNSFDWVTIFDACHDQTRPDLCLKEIHRVLKPGGVFSMIEIKGTSNVFEDKKEGDGSAVLYGISLFHCLPIGSNADDALCLGNKWGEKRARELLQQAGFQRIDVLNLPFTSANVLYNCRKEV